MDRRETVDYISGEHLSLSACLVPTLYQLPLCYTHRRTKAELRVLILSRRVLCPAQKLDRISSELPSGLLKVCSKPGVMAHVGNLSTLGG